MKKILTPVFATSLLLVTSCKTEFENDVTAIAVTKGDADFNTYVALGNSLTSGYRDNALYLDGQNESYPNMLANQMKLAGGGEFTQPLIPNNIGGFKNIDGFGGKLTLQVIDGKELLPVPSVPAADLDILVNKSYNNMGVPGAKSFHLIIPGYGSKEAVSLGKGNPYFVRFASSPTASVLSDAMAKKPTFFSLWIGNNDVLSYASNGGAGEDRTGNMNVADYGMYDITDPSILAGSIKKVLEGMKSVGATKGVIANIPNIENIPFFTTIPVNPLSAAVLGGNNVDAGEKNIEELNIKLYGPIKQVLTALGQGDRINLLSKTGGNPLLIKDETLTNLSAQITAALTPKLGIQAATAVGLAFGQARQTKAGDLIPLTTRAIIGKTPDTKKYPYAQGDLTKFGVTFPMDDAHILIPSEIEAIRKATISYNNSIKTLADAYGLAFVDANAKMQELSGISGIQYDSVKYTTAFVTGGAFSLDGVHLTGRGYAVIANEFIKAINGKYKSNLPQVNVNKYSGVTFPK